jgi:uracil-DNA glycosylase
VDARERLRRYLEQRREMGESELMLDGMSVEDVMRVLGAQNLSSGVGKRTGAEAARRDEGGAWGSSSFETRPDEPPGPEEEDADAPESDSPVTRPVESDRAPAAEHGSDWRAALRAADAAAPGGDDVPRPKKPAAGPGQARAVEVDRARATTPRPGDVPEAPRGMEESASPGAATPEATRGARPPAPAPAGGAGSAPALDDVGAPPGLEVGQAAQDLFAGPLASVRTLDEIARLVARCQACPLYSTAINPVPGEGSPDADLMCVGEAPGQTEDETGRPFVGAAGQLLTKILAAIKLSREEVFIANVLKHRPPGNRNPRPEEVEACSPYLVKQIELVRPKVIVAFGTFAAQTLLNTKLAIGKLRGSVHRYYGVPLVVTYHPAALLRNPAWKRPTWEDVQLARRILDRARATGA